VILMILSRSLPFQVSTVVRLVFARATKMQQQGRKQGKSIPSSHSRKFQ